MTIPPQTSNLASQFEDGYPADSKTFILGGKGI